MVSKEPSKEEEVTVEPATAVLVGKSPSQPTSYSWPCTSHMENCYNTHWVELKLIFPESKECMKWSRKLVFMISWAEGKVAFNGVALVLNARQQMSLLVVKMIVSLHRISDASPHMGMTSNKTRRVVISKELYQVFKKHKYLSNLYISQLYL